MIILHIKFEWSITCVFDEAVIDDEAFEYICLHKKNELIPVQSY